MQDFVDYILNNPLYLIAIVVLVTGLIVSIVKRLLKLVFALCIVILVLGIILYFFSENSQMREIVAPVHEGVEQVNTFIVKESPKLLQKVKRATDSILFQSDSASAGSILY